VTAELFQVAETLPQAALEQMHAVPKRDEPVATPADLEQADGVLFGFPTRFGMVPAQVKTLFDACASQWAAGALIGKPCGTFFSTGSIGGGQEVTAMSTMPFFASQGMVYVPLGMRSAALGNCDEVHGGSVWGAGSIAGHNNRPPSTLELEVARVQGESFARLAQAIAAVPML
jgi:NAD(P)H dehydrogenase (quinone)